MSRYLQMVAAITLGCLALVNVGLAADEIKVKEKTPEERKAEDAAATTAKDAADSTSETKWASLGFAAGVGVTFLSNRNIESAEVHNGVIRVTSEQKQQRGVWLESHYLLCKWGANKRFGFGPFLGLQIGSEDGLFNAVGAGLIVAMRRAPLSPVFNNLGFNVGIGATSSKIQVLGDEMRANQALPTGEESVRFKDKDDVGLLVIFSFGFASGARADSGSIEDQSDPESPKR
jgi:hypothetical protein